MTCIRTGLFVALAVSVGAAVWSEPNAVVRRQITNIFETVPDDQMYSEVLKVVLEVMESPYGVFGYIDEEGAFVVPSLTGEVWEKCQVPGKTFVFPRAEWGNSTWPRAIRERRTITQNGVSTLTPEGHIPIGRHISMPIIHQGTGEVIGLFQVANKATPYTPEDVAKLEAIAGYVALILNERLEAERADRRAAVAEERAETLQVVNVSHQRLLGAAIPVIVLFATILIAVGVAKTKIQRNTNDIQKHEKDINGVHTRVDGVVEKVGDVEVAVGGVDVKIDMLLVHNKLKEAE